MLLCVSVSVNGRDSWRKSIFRMVPMLARFSGFAFVCVPKPRDCRDFFAPKLPACPCSLPYDSHWIRYGSPSSATHFSGTAASFAASAFAVPPEQHLGSVELRPVQMSLFSYLLCSQSVTLAMLPFWQPVPRYACFPKISYSIISVPSIVSGAAFCVAARVRLCVIGACPLVTTLREFCALV